MDARDTLDALTVDPELAGRCVHRAVVPERPAVYADPSEPLLPEITERLAARGIERCYAHQAAAIDAVTAGRDIVLEIEVDGARQVKAIDPSAILIFVLPPSREEQRARLRGRGDADQKVEQRVRKAEEEEPVGRALADHVLVNDDLDATIARMAAIVVAARAARGA